MPSKLLQLMKSRNESGVIGIAESVFEEISQSLINQNEFFIVGHSFGSLVALKIASMLEKSGKMGRLVLIDGSPEYLFRLAYGVCQRVHVEGDIENDLFMILFGHFCNPESTEEFVKGLVACKDITSKIDCLAEFVSDDYKSKYSKEYLYNITVAILNRLKLIVALDVGKDEMAGLLDTKLKSPITLIRPTEVSFTDIEEDYNLNKFSENEVNVKYVDGHHLTVLENIELTNMLNEIISQEISK